MCAQRNIVGHHSMTKKTGFYFYAAVATHPARKEENQVTVGKLRVEFVDEEVRVDLHHAV